MQPARYRVRMPVQQVNAPPARAAIFLVFTVSAKADLDAVRGFVEDFSSITRGVSFRVPGDHVIGNLGIGSDLWQRLYDAPAPKHLHPFAEIKGDVHTAVATPGDLLFHLRSQHLGSAFELARQIRLRLDGLAEVADEVHGFKFFDERDLLGFVDGTENPEGERAEDVVRIGDEDPAYRDGSYVIVQKYLHDLTAWGALSVEEQQLVIGRTKVEDVELADDVKPSNSHVALNTIELADGTQRQIVRENMPFGQVGAGEFGTYFIGYGADPGITEQMLRNMFIGKPAGNHDRILDFSTAHTGSLYFVPSENWLDGPPS